MTLKLSDLDVLLTPEPKLPAGVTTRWGTVTQVAPLRVVLDGDETAMPITPASLVTNIRVTDRVLVMLSGRQMTILGVYGGPTVETPQGTMWDSSTSLPDQVWTKIQFSNSTTFGGVTVDDGGLKVPVTGWYIISLSAQIGNVGWGSVGDLFEIRAYSALGGASCRAAGPFAPWTELSAVGQGQLLAGSIVHGWAALWRAGSTPLVGASLSLTKVG